MTFDQFEEFVMSSDCYWEHDVSYIDKEGLQHLISPFEFYQYQIQVAKLICRSRCHYQDRTDGKTLEV